MDDGQPHLPIRHRLKYTVSDDHRFQRQRRPVTVDRGTITFGDVQRFPLYVKAGRDVLGYGTSTGVHRTDVLSVENPLTIEVFETRRNFIGFGFALPTPTPAPPPTGQSFHRFGRWSSIHLSASSPVSSAIIHQF